MKSTEIARVVGSLVWLLVAFGVATLPAAPASARRYSEPREACTQSDPLRQPFFGDTHVHTVYSFDANGQDTRNTPRDAYRLAKGGEIGLQPYDAAGKPLRTAKLSRPLDFTVVTDHSEMLGEIEMCSTPGTPGYGSDLCWVYQNFRPATFTFFAVRNMIQRRRFEFCGEKGELCLDQARVVWKDIQAAAEEAYDRTAQCSFTSFVGYEWTASGAAGANLHRNVIFRNASVPGLPVSSIDVESAFGLWRELQRQCIDGAKGCDALTIPHNSNLSGPGLIFQSARLPLGGGAAPAVDAEEARLRQRWEPLVEIMQHKGDSECLIGGDTTDEACGFEKLPYNSFAGVGRIAASNISSAVPGTAEMDHRPNRPSMVREALKSGLATQAKLGTNPLKFGIVASSDTHLGAPGLVEEWSAKGHGGAGARSTRGLPDDLEFNPGGLAVLWAEENSRDALFDAMERREAYGTSGTRPVVRFFGGFDFDASLCSGSDFAKQGYARGVPMGGDLKRGAAGKAPTFAVWALQDPGTPDRPGTPLDRIQIVKGWVENGQTHERVVEVVSAKGEGRVDPKTCETSGQGAGQLCRVWKDDAFDAKQHAFYYARVLENPTCRWSQRLCVEAGVDCAKPGTVTPGYEGCCRPDHVPTVQERAWTSPIWYTP
ncbi:DUF3604 domain-containing protein [Myxococcota bacterium]|nr:DUF3604 domain-containing protein [Myxococcota bacterium]